MNNLKREGTDEVFIFFPQNIIEGILNNLVIKMIVQWRGIEKEMLVLSIPIAYHRKANKLIKVGDW